MDKPHPLALRERFVALAEEGNTHGLSAAQFRVSIKFANNIVKPKRNSGSLNPKPEGSRGHGKLSRVAGWVREKMAAQPVTRLDEMSVVLKRKDGISV